ncbi:glycerate kinase family protein [Carbonactinospora thermoautotrophica]|uniref:glycerate kinase family protein n=1 Tax=Carbonactinospora thermoautotrophica TaxID=1469144 RepID=UPI000AE85981|nr:glycerate kinase [Carbonactinospora thermoautotrophica]
MPVRVLIAPDKFAGTLTAVQAAEAIAAGWRRTAPHDDLDLAPLADGGPGFVEVLHQALGGELISVTVTGPLGEPVPGVVLLTEEDGVRTAYVESAQACGLELVPEDRRDPGATTTYGVGELIAAAVDQGAARIVVGLGGSATNDGGAGLLAALGAEPADRLRRGGAALATLDQVDLVAARARVAGVELVAASDVDNPLLGLRGASNVFGPQKGATAEQVHQLDAALTRWAELADRKTADAKGAGAAGGLGYGLLLLGARRVPGIETVLQAVGLPDRAARADLVLTGEGSFDFQSLRGKVVSGVAALAGRYAKPCVVLAGQVKVGRREMGAMGVESAYAVTEVAGSRQEAMARPAEHLERLAARVARTWSR